MRECIIEEIGYEVLQDSRDYRRGSSFYVEYLAQNKETGQYFLLEYITDDDYGDDTDFEIYEVDVEEKVITNTIYTYKKK